MFGYGRTQYDFDISQLEKLHQQGTQMYTKYLSGDTMFSFFDWPRLQQWDRRIEGMKQRCKGKLLASVSRMKDKEAK